MTLTEKTAYIKGLCEGLELDKKDSAEAKIIKALIDLCDDMAKEIDDIECDIADLADYCEELDEDLGALEEYVYECDCDYDCDCCDDEDEFDFDDDEDDFEDYEEDELDWDEDEDYEEGFDFGDEDTTIYEVECACGEIINFDEEVLEKGSMTCPNCGETLEFSFDDEDEE